MSLEDKCKGTYRFANQGKYLCLYSLHREGEYTSGKCQYQGKPVIIDLKTRRLYCNVCNYEKEKDYL